jgi:hypothetical protein
MRKLDDSSTPGRYTRFSRSRSIVAACCAVRVCSVVRSPPRASSTASAVPNEPAPITVARLAPGAASDRARDARARELGVGSDPPGLGVGSETPELGMDPDPPGFGVGSETPGLGVGSGAVIS